jgi:protein TonB
MKQERTPDLTDLAFAGRNKDYGAYRLRKRYFRYLAFAFIAGTILAVFLVAVPEIYYYLEPVPLIDDDFLYEAEYTVMSVVPDEELNALAQAYSKPEEQQTIPVVTDSVVPETKKQEEEIKPEPPVNPEQKPDSTSQQNGNGSGSGEGVETGVSVIADVRPQFPGGDESRLKFLRQNIQYPEEAIRKKIQGVVMTSFIIERDGSVSNIRVISGIGGGCDEEAIRVIRQMPRWEPARRNGKVVRIILKMPILFRIPGTARPK